MATLDTWAREYGKLQSKGQEFALLHANLLSSPSVPGDPPEVEIRRQALLRTAAMLQKNIESARAAGNVLSGHMDLGIWPLVLIGGAVSGITYWVSDTAKFISDRNEVKRLVSEGVNRVEANDIVKGNQTSLGAGIAKLSKVLGWGVGALLIWKMM